MQQLDTQPWYKQFWPWFIISLPASVVVAGFITLWIAINQPDTVVKDNYYKDGLAINREIAKDEIARSRELTAAVTIDKLTGEVLVELSSNQADYQPTELALQLIHPVDAKQDLLIPLKFNAATARYQGELAELHLIRWYLRLENSSAAPADIWRIDGELNLKFGDKTHLRPAEA